MNFTLKHLCSNFLQWQKNRNLLSNLYLSRLYLKPNYIGILKKIESFIFSLSHENITEYLETKITFVEISLLISNFKRPLIKLKCGEIWTEF